MTKRIFSILQYVIFMGGGIFLVWWQLRSMTEPEMEEFLAALRHTRYWVVLPIIIMALLSHYSRALRWKLLMEPLGYAPSTANTFASTMVGYLANAAVPRLGEILKCSLLARYEKLKLNKLIGTIIIERTFDLICYLFFIALTVLIQIDTVGRYVGEKLSSVSPGSDPLSWLRPVIAIASIIIIWLGLRWLFKRYPDHGLVSKLKAFTSGLAEGFAAIRQLKKRKAFIAHTLFIWLMYLLQIFLGFYAMEGTIHLGIKAAFSVLTLATLAMIITPGGIGSFPIFVMQTLLLYQIDPTLGKAFGWLMWGVATGIIIIAGCVALIVLPYINKEKNESHTKHPFENS
ncbi:MAG TPA: hypothetical protein DHV17_01060 [Chitinophagaceae bacterium]|nr:hypothetical protein [Chitinophagaceae bacterium]